MKRVDKIAALFGKTATVKLLLEKGASLNLKDAYGITAPDLAIKQGHKDVAKLLKKHGAKE